MQKMADKAKEVIKLLFIVQIIYVLELVMHKCPSQKIAVKSGFSPIFWIISCFISLLGYIWQQKNHFDNMRLLLATTLFLFQISLLAQDEFSGFTVMNMQNFGLRSNSVNRIYQDSIGYIWICTNGGISRYDGVALTHLPFDKENPHSLPEAIAQDIMMDCKGRYWVVSPSCLSMYDPRLPADSAVTRFLNAPNDATIPSLHQLQFGFEKDNQCNLWLPFWKNGLLRINTDSLTFHVDKIPLQNRTGFQEQIGSVKILEDGISLLLGADEGPIIWNWQKKKAVHLKAKIIKVLSEAWKQKPDEAWSSSFYFKGRGDNLLFIQPGKPLVNYYIHTGKAVIIELSGAAIEGDFQYTLFEDSRGYLWIPTFHFGVFIVNLKTGMTLHKKQTRLDPYSIGGNWTSHILEDRQGNIWLAHWLGGLSKFSPIENPFKVHFPLGLSETFPPKTEFQWLDEDENETEFLLCNDRKMVRIKGELNFLELPEISFNALNFGEGKLWVGKNGFLKFDPQAKKMIPANTKVSKEMMEILQTSTCALYDTVAGRAVIWVSIMQKGLYLFDISRQSLELFYTDTIVYGLNKVAVPEIMAKNTNSNLWLRLSGGLAFFDVKRKQMKAWVYDPEETPEMPQPPYWDFMVDSEDRVWITSQSHGTSWFKGEKWHGINKLIPGISNRSFKVAEDKKGNIWFTTNLHLVRYHLESGAYKIFAGGDGWRGMQSGANIFFNHRGELVLPAIDHISYLNPDEVVTIDTPTTIISGFKVFEKNCSELLHLHTIILPYDQSFITFQLGCINFINPKGNRFKWKLEGADKDWVEPKDNRSFATYSTLPPGNYTFYVKSCNADGIWDEKGAMIKVTILPPWWKTWWFQGLYTLAAAALVWWLFRQNTLRQLDAQRAEIEKHQALERERERIARNMHDDLGSGLSAIHLLSNFAKNKANDPAIRSEMEKIAASSANLNQNIREIIWTVNSADDTLPSLMLFLRRYCADFQENTGLEVQFNAPIALPETTLSGEVRRNLFLCVKEALNNAAKFAKATKVEVKLASSDNRISITVRDYGGGFDVESALKNGGNGLKNMQHRMKEIGGTATIESQLGATELHFEVMV